MQADSDDDGRNVPSTRRRRESATRHCERRARVRSLLIRSIDSLPRSDSHAVRNDARDDDDDDDARHPRRRSTRCGDDARRCDAETRRDGDADGDEDADESCDGGGSGGERR